MKLSVASSFQTWCESDDLDEKEDMAMRLWSLFIGIVDINKDGDLDDAESAVLETLLNYAWDYLSEKGVSDDDGISAIGMDKTRFFKLSDAFKNSYLDIHGTSLKERRMDNGVEYCINSEEELLLYTLFSLKSGLTYDLLGLFSGMDGSNAKCNQDTGLAILAKTLAALGCSQKRSFMNKKDFEDLFLQDKSTHTGCQ